MPSNCGHTLLTRESRIAFLLIESQGEHYLMKFWLCHQEENQGQKLLRNANVVHGRHSEAETSWGDLLRLGKSNG